MSERKVLNKYYPPDFDPSKIPKLREGKNKVFSIRIMAPFNMRCDVCGEYIYKGKKFNSRKENVDDEDFLGLRIFRFYIRCPKCVAEIAFKTDLKNTDYTLEAGATRLFEAERLAQQMAEQERQEKEAEELNPMKVLENRTKASHKEMAQIDELEELREINARHAKVDTSVLLERQKLYEEHLERLQQEEEEQIVKSIFGNKRQQTIKRLADSDSDQDDDLDKPKLKKPALEPGKAASDLLVDPKDSSSQTTSSKEPAKKSMESWQKSVGSLSSTTKKGLAGLVVKKKTATPSTASSSSTSSSAAASSSSLSAVSSSSATVSSSSSSSSTAAAGSGVKGGGEGPSGASSAVSSSALGLLGDYSGSDSAEESS